MVRQPCWLDGSCLVLLRRIFLSEATRAHWFLFGWMFTAVEHAFVSFLVPPLRICVCVFGRGLLATCHPPLTLAIGGIHYFHLQGIPSSFQRCHLANEEIPSHVWIWGERTKHCIFYQLQPSRSRGRCPLQLCCPLLFFALDELHPSWWRRARVLMT